MAVKVSSQPSHPAGGFFRSMGYPPGRVGDDPGSDKFATTFENALRTIGKLPALIPAFDFYSLCQLMNADSNFALAGTSQEKMMKKLLLAALISTSLVSVAAAADMVAPMQPPAAEDNGMGFYIGSLSSVNFLKHTDFDVAGVNVNTKYDTGYYSAIRAGYNFGSYGYVAPRVELEVGYGSASVDEHRVSGFGGVGSIDSYGDANTIQGFVNGYLDIPLAQPGDTGVLSMFTPYVGGGVGAMNVKLRKQGVGGVGTLMDDDDTAFAYHLDAGVGINLQSVFSGSNLFEKTTLDVGYRYTAADSLSFTARDGTNSSTDFSTNAITIGLRKQF